MRAAICAVFFTMTLPVYAGDEVAPSGTWHSSLPDKNLGAIKIEFFDDRTALVITRDKTQEIDVKPSHKPDRYILRIRSNQKDDTEILFTFEMKSKHVAILASPLGDVFRMAPSK